MKYYDMKLLCSECGHEINISAEAIERRWNSLEHLLEQDVKPKTPRKSIRKQLRAAIDELMQIADEVGCIDKGFGLRIDAATDKVRDAKDQL